MRFLVVLFAFSQVLIVKSLPEVLEYIGGNVTLSSGVDPSWNLIRIEWSIFPNTTWIATYSSLKTNVDRFYSYKGRLTLNQTSGDLTIHNLRQEDATDYSVNLLNTENKNKVNEIRLRVKQHLQKPTINQIQNTATENGCFMLLSCSSQDNNVDFSWKVTPHSLSNWINTKGGPSQLLVYVNTQAPVTFTCTSSRQMESTSEVFISPCNVTHKEPCYRDRCGVGISCSVAVVVVLMCCFRGYLIAVVRYLRGKLCP